MQDNFLKGFPNMLAHKIAMIFANEFSKSITTKFQMKLPKGIPKDAQYTNSKIFWMKLFNNLLKDILKKLPNKNRKLISLNKIIKEITKCTFNKNLRNHF